MIVRDGRAEHEYVSLVVLTAFAKLFRNGQKSYTFVLSVICSPFLLQRNLSFVDGMEIFV